MAAPRAIEGPAGAVVADVPDRADSGTPLPVLLRIPQLIEDGGPGHGISFKLPGKRPRVAQRVTWMVLLVLGVCVGRWTVAGRAPRGHAGAPSLPEAAAADGPPVVPAAPLPAGNTAPSRSEGDGPRPARLAPVIVPLEPGGSP